ncbi:MAG: SAVED domain-containing protein [Sphingobacteriaceae bacterium]|nr:SAVED domain-containing protein [Sphingobacteriaceae bacterium]
MSVSSITDKNKYLLWVRSGGRCEYEGCNKSLTQDILTKRNFNQSYIAHIVADVAGGPRGCAIRSPLLSDDITNLMLLCDTHHRLIDKHDIAGHPEPKLILMKKNHEDRIERQTAIAPNMSSHIVTYKANVGVHTPVVTYESVEEYLLPNHYPAQASAIDLGLSNSPQRDRNASFWQTEVENLETQFGEQLRPKLRKNEINHLSLFAFAPMPLLMKLGVLLNDIQDIEVHQSVRSPKTWNLSDDKGRVRYVVTKPTNTKKPIVALNISLSATINNNRITAVLGEECNIYTLTIASPFNDFLKNKVHLADFSVAARKLLNEIKSVYGAGTELHVFPAMPIATAIELGRVWMPKADMPLVIYDENTSLGGFTKAIEIKNS